MNTQSFWARHHNGYSNEAQADKVSFHHRAKSQLRKVAGALGLKIGDHTIRTNMGGVAVTGETVLHGENVYVMVGDTCSSLGILARRCKGRGDYTGGTNNWLDYDLLDDPKAFAAALGRLRP